MCQPGGKELTILGLFEGALGAIGALWEYGLEVRKASGEPTAGLSWGIKKTQCARRPSTATHSSPAHCVLHLLSPRPPRPAAHRPSRWRAPVLDACRRIWYKLATKYGGDVSKVTDCARISLEFGTAEGLLAAAIEVLKLASTFKNRVANATDEGYRDLMFTVKMGTGHICEVCVHVPAPSPVQRRAGSRPHARRTPRHGVRVWGRARAALAPFARHWVAS